MAVSQDFEARRRERIMRNRKKKQRLRRIRLIVLSIIAVIIVVVIISNISKCASSNQEQSASNNSAVTTQIPYETQTPLPTQTPDTVSEIPAPVKGDNNFLDEIMRSGQKKHVYLTFDDGPNETITPQILDILRRYDVKATFFMIGKYIENNPYICTRVIEEGHLAAPHAYSHDYATIYADATSFRDEVEKTYKLIVDNTPGNKEPFKIFRFPGGSAQGTYSSQKESYKDDLAEMGYYYCDWNSLTGDAEGTKKDAAGLIQYFKQTRPNVNNLIILMHDAGGKQATVDALPQLIELLMQEGYTFSRLDELDYSNMSKATQQADSAADDTDNDTDTSSSSDSSSGSSDSSSSSDTKKSSSTSSTSGKSSSSGASSNSSSTSSSSSSSEKSSSDKESSSSNKESDSSGSSSSSSKSTTAPSATQKSEKKDNVIEPE